MRSIDSQQKHWQSEVSGEGIYKVLDNAGSEMGTHVDRSRPQKESYTALAFLHENSMSNASTRSLY